MDHVTDPPAGNLSTDRLVLGTWSDRDAEGLYELSNDRQVMRHFHRTPTWEQIEEMVDRHRENLEAGRPGLYAVRVAESEEFIGFVGLATPRFDASFMPCVEIGWRLKRDAWGHGYATEAARAVLAHGFGTLRLEEIVSFTAVENTPSIAVMKRLGMHTDPAEDFDHPSVPEGHPVRRHVLYRLTAREWRTAHPGVHSEV
ncbi:MAG: Acetyltransferase, GNAT family [uncultured Nocardioidaceae bacterium]|uniref:Acetyltransferase, GNAT family n=1 Tax=uncultured Nocardioidaceae bacterium TaxID=253824 RepID=A0A6J4NX40_9ACTN|nr:MAG: Acetyltransferase, GNAT family [uncultured Nocardioidaceae bacterium]